MLTNFIEKVRFQDMTLNTSLKNWLSRQGCYHESHRLKSGINISRLLAFIAQATVCLLQLLFKYSFYV
jgi:hypothetical protein